MSNIVKKTLVDDMSDEQKHDLSKVLTAVIQMQSAIHTLDEITNQNNKLRFRKKMEWNNFISSVRSFCDNQEIDLYKLTAVFQDIGQTDNYLDCVKRFDDLAREIEINLDKEM